MGALIPAQARTHMEDVTCQDCGRTWMVNLDYLNEGLLDGRYVKAERLSKGENLAGQMVDRYEEVYLGICPQCRIVKQKAGQRPLSVEEEGAAIQEILRRLRAEHPEWSLEQAAHEAVEEFNDPRRERHPEFRKYLVHRRLS